MEFYTNDEIFPKRPQIFLLVFNTNVLLRYKVQHTFFYKSFF